MMTSSSHETPALLVQAACGCSHARSFDGASPYYRPALAAVNGPNVLGFVVVAVGSRLADSASLAANTLDFTANGATTPSASG
jgi:hypothetical protein